MNIHRRDFLGRLTGLAGLGLLIRPGDLRANARSRAEERIASNVYPWITFFQREGRDWASDLDGGLREFARSHVKGYEPSLSAPEQLETLAPLLDKHGLHMRSIYVGSNLHEAGEAEQNIGRVLAIAKATRQAGVEIVVTNPNPIRWGGQEDKTDAQLEFQAATLDRLGAGLREMDMVLAYHNHDAEMRRSAREFHHMMLGTDPQNVSLCLDAHWVFRGSGDSQVALFDVVTLYGPRIVELHLRQSKDGIWTEVLGEGDIDYARLAAELQRLGLHPHVVLEQAVEKGTPHTMGPVEAHRRSLAYAAEVFGGLIQ